MLSVIIQEYNISTFNKQFPYHNGLITCADEASYLRPPVNFIDIGEWKDNSNGKTSYFLRPPGYGLLFLTCKLISPSNPWLILKVIQLLGFFLSILLFYNIFFNLSKSLKATLISSTIYALTPCFSGFIYFTITEGITPFLTLLICFFWVKLMENDSKKVILFYILSSSIFLLVRPQLIIFPVIFQLVFALQSKYKLFFITSLLFLPLIIWNIRTININGSFPGLHPIYSYTNNGLYRPSHEKLTDLYRIWEHHSDIFHTSIGQVAFDTSSLALNNALSYVPNKFHDDIKPILKEFQHLKQYQYTHFKYDDTIKGAYENEINFENKVMNLKAKLIKKHPFDFYIFTPLKSFKKLILSSHLNLKIFQQDFRGNFLMEILRCFCLLIVVTSIMICFPAIFEFKNKIIFSLGLSIFIYVFYLIYFQRLNEERYITPIIPIGFLIVCFYFTKWKNVFFKATLFKNLK